MAQEVKDHRYILSWENHLDNSIHGQIEYYMGEEMKILEHVFKNPQNDYTLERVTEISLDDIKPKNVVWF